MFSGLPVLLDALGLARLNVLVVRSGKALAITFMVIVAFFFLGFCVLLLTDFRALDLLLSWKLWKSPSFALSLAGSGGTGALDRDASITI